MKKILLLFLAAVLTGCGIYLAFYIYGGYREDKEIKDSMKSVELLQSQAVVPEEDTGDGQAPDEPDGNTLSINPGISVDFGVLSDTNPDIVAWLHIPDTYTVHDDGRLYKGRSNRNRRAASEGVGSLSGGRHPV